MKNSITATYYIICVNYFFYVCSLVFPLNNLMLNHSSPEFFQFVTSIFLHANFTHISGNMFFTYFFGKLIEEKIGSKELYILFICTGLFTNISEYFLNFGENIYSLGASGAVFGLFSTSLLLNSRKVWKDWVELLVLAPFVVSYMFSELSSLNANDSISHSAHLTGAVIGPIFYKLLKRK